MKELGRDIYMPEYESSISIKSLTPYRILQGNLHYKKDSKIISRSVQIVRLIQSTHTDDIATDELTQCGAHIKR